MKKLIFITLLLSFFVNAQIELRFNDFYGKNGQNDHHISV